jgi:hypothetical protein
MKVLLMLVTAWLSANFDLPAEHEQPNIKLITQQQMVTFRYGGSAANSGRELVALYDDKTRTIFLSDRWTGGTPTELSVLVHEMVHHLQNVANLRHECPAAREALAYAAQEKWLGLFGKSLASEFEIDPLTLKISTACM